MNKQNKKNREFILIKIYKEYGFIFLLRNCFLIIILMIKRNLIWLYLKTKTKNGLLIKEILGNKMILDLNGLGMDFKESSLHKQLALDSIREAEATKILREEIKKGDVIVEIGANIGYYVLMEASIISPTGKIYAIEPGPKNIELLKKNIALNNCSRLVDIFPMAISDKEGVSSLFIAKESNYHSFVYIDGIAKSHIKVKTMSLDKFLEGKRDVNFIRMDVEGWEYKIIRGMIKTLKTDKLRKLFIEIHPHRVDPEFIISMLETLKKLGFETKKIISHDTFFRKVLRQTIVEDLSIEQLINDKRIIKGEKGFEIFFEKKKKI